MNKKLFKRVFLLIKDFLTNLLDQKINFYAASMSWATLFFIIPFLVIIFSITLNMPLFNEYYEKIYQFITSNLMPTNSTLIINSIDKFIQNANKMGYIGFIYVIIAAILFFKDFDYIVNDIFDTKQRSFLNALIFYTALLLLIPITIAISIWFLMLIDSKLHLFSQLVLQFLIVWIVVFIIYKFTPKEKISVKVVALSSFVATLIWSIAKTLFILYISLNKTYTTIYGAVSIVLFLFLWIYISWVIFLYGLQLCTILDENKEEN